MTVRVVRLQDNAITRSLFCRVGVKTPNNGSNGGGNGGSNGEGSGAGDWQSIVCEGAATSFKFNSAASNEGYDFAPFNVYVDGVLVTQVVGGSQDYVEGRYELFEEHGIRLGIARPDVGLLWIGENISTAPKRIKLETVTKGVAFGFQIGRASCRERV